MVRVGLGRGARGRRRLLLVAVVGRDRATIPVFQINVRTAGAVIAAAVVLHPLLVGLVDRLGAVVGVVPAIALGPGLAVDDAHESGAGVDARAELLGADLHAAHGDRVRVVPERRVLVSDDERSGEGVAGAVEAGLSPTAAVGVLDAGDAGAVDALATLGAGVAAGAAVGGVGGERGLAAVGRVAVAVAEADAALPQAGSPQAGDVGVGVAPADLVAVAAMLDVAQEVVAREPAGRLSLRADRAAAAVTADEALGAGVAAGAAVGGVGVGVDADATAVVGRLARAGRRHVELGAGVHSGGDEHVTPTTDRTIRNFVRWVVRDKAAPRHRDSGDESEHETDRKMAHGCTPCLWSINPDNPETTIHRHEIKASFL